jgi:hypothetical protein
MILVEYSHNHPALAQPLARVPGTKVTWEQSFDQLSGPTQTIIRVECPDFAAFEAALADDPGTANPVLVAEQGDVRLYRFDLSEAGMAANILPKVIEVGGVIQHGVGTAEGWRGRMRLPNREALEQVYRFNRGNGLEFTIHSIYEPADWTVGAGPGLTEGQQEILVAAVNSGYLEIPRKASLAELAASLGVSETAASERFRRAVKNLVVETVHPNAAE